MMAQAPTRDRGVPRALRNTIPRPLPRSKRGRISRTYNATAPRARRPSGTTRSFEPFPNIRATPSSYRTSWSASPTSSETRAPVAYANSSTARSRIEFAYATGARARGRVAPALQDVLKREPHQLGDACPGRVRELEHGPVADRERLVGIGCPEQALDLGDRQHRGETAPLAGTLEPLARVPRGPTLADEKAVVRPDRGDLAADGRGREAQVLEGIHELAQLDAGHVLGMVGALGRRVADEAPDVAHVVAHRVRARPRFEGEIVPELLQPERPLQLARRHNHRRTRAW